MQALGALSWLAGAKNGMSGETLFLGHRLKYGKVCCMIWVKKRGIAAIQSLGN